jgi:FMN phosphatase YigB (HAD superfamily)
VALEQVEAVLFDMGGTLVDYPLPSRPALAVRCVRGAISFLVRPEAELLPPAARLPSPEVAHGRRRRAGPETALAHRAAIALRRVIRAVSGHTLPQMAEACLRPIVIEGRAYGDTLTTLRALVERGYRLGLISNTPWGTPDYLWEQQAEKFGLAGLLQVRLFSSDVGVRKPDPRIFLEALRRLGVPPERALFVGDAPVEDIGGAAGVGMRTALVVRGGRFPDACRHPPDLRVSGLQELLDHLPRAAREKS